MLPNQHMAPLRAPLRGQQSAVPKPAQAGMGSAGGSSPFTDAAKARTGAYPDPSWQPPPSQQAKSAGNALPAQHQAAQAASSPGIPAGQAVNPTGDTAPQKQYAAPQGQGAPAAPMNMPQQSGGMKTAANVYKQDVGRYGEVRDAMKPYWLGEAAKARANQQASAEKTQAGKAAYGAADAGVAGAMEALGNSAAQPAVGMDWDPAAAGGKGAWVEGNPIDTGTEGIEENAIDVMGKSVSDYLMPEDLKKKQQGELFKQAAEQRRLMQQTLGARGIGASGIAASELGGIDKGLQSAYAQMDTADWQQAVEQRQNELQTYLDAYGKTLSEENRLKIFEEMQDAEKQGNFWAAQSNIAGSLGGDKMTPEAMSQYWKLSLGSDGVSGTEDDLTPEQIAAQFNDYFTTRQNNDETVIEVGKKKANETPPAPSTPAEQQQQELLDSQAMNDGPQWWQGEFLSGDAEKRRELVLDAIGSKPGLSWNMLSPQERSDAWAYMQQKGWV